MPVTEEAVSQALRESLEILIRDLDETDPHALINVDKDRLSDELERIRVAHSATLADITITELERLVRGVWKDDGLNDAVAYGEYLMSLDDMQLEIEAQMNAEQAAILGEMVTKRRQLGEELRGALQLTVSGVIAAAILARKISMVVI